MLRRAKFRRMQCSKRGCLFDHLIGAGEQRCWDGQTERSCRFEIDRQMDLCRLHDRKVLWFFTLENPTNIDAPVTIRAWQAGSIAQQAASHDVFAPSVASDDRVLCR